jgi:hypothetical protein
MLQTEDEEVIIGREKGEGTMDDGRWTMDDGRWTMDDDRLSRLPSH